MNIESWVGVHQVNEKPWAVIRGVFRKTELCEQKQRGMKEQQAFKKHLSSLVMLNIECKREIAERKTQRSWEGPDPVVLYSMIRIGGFPLIMNKKSWLKTEERQTKRVWQEAR